VVRQRACWFWALGLFFCLSGCGDPSREAPQTVASDVERHRQAVDSHKTVSAPSGLSTPSRASAQAKASSPTQPSLTPSSQADSSKPSPSSSVSADHEAWQQWYATARESPDISVRLQALETWAQRPGDQLDPVTYGLVDQDDSVRQRAQELYEQQLVREATAAAPSEPVVKEPSYVRGELVEP
jgi:DNA polymerase III gamma/tau subunit